MRKMSLLEALWHLKRGGKYRQPGYGICWHLAELCDSTEQRLQAKEWMQGWPEFSGCTVYPVPSTNCEFPDSAYDEALCEDTMWAGAYGAARIRLVNYLITRAQEVYHA